MQLIKNIIHQHKDHENLDEIKDAPYWTPNLSLVKVIKVHDGDTFHVIGNATCSYHEQVGACGYHKYVVRLRDLDTPELNDPKDRKDLGKLAQAKLAEKILNKIILLKDIGKDKYGRLLCHAYMEDVDLSKWMIDQGLGYEYHGGKKKE